ncbi:trypsin-like peptidase domain-containing protein [Salibacteraceae bacterium]|nr:trypsin-like peptidase domain-containing protein [Salibacteraceae bacterium]MDC1204005.1 trypsin-like peptidase domain-containing protein [Salibacteraceae bacterium]
MKKTLVLIASAMVGGFVSLGIHETFLVQNSELQSTVIEKDVPVHFARNVAPGVPDLTFAAEKSLAGVVNVKTIFRGQDYYQSNPIFDLLYGRPRYMPQPEGTGSGVIISDDGYIVTNNHVVDGAEKVKITLNDKKHYEAKIIGRDPSTDLALLKIEATDLPYLQYANSDDIKVGEWVLAVGNPFNLNSTVTAGIISAKGRDINILQSDPRSGISPVEAFIQTDAAVNPGNSGGALVNTAGELVGINAAIKSNTGSFAGYSFAIPANITKKVVSDLMEFGAVQRAFIGVSIQDLSEDVIKKNDLKLRDGIFIAAIAEDGGAKAGGMLVGDVVTNINSKKVNNVPEFQEQLSNFRPGDKISVTVNRQGESKKLELTLRNQYGSTELIDKTVVEVSTLLGAQFSPIDDKMKKRLSLKNGVQVQDLKSGKLMKAGVREGFIIVRVDGKHIENQDELNVQLKGKQGGGVLIEGIYPNGKMAYYGLGM